MVRVWERFLQGNRFSSSAEGLPVTGLRGAYGHGVKNRSQMGPLQAEGCASYQSPLSWGQRARLQSLGNKQEAVASPAALLQLHHPIRASTYLLSFLHFSSFPQKKKKFSLHGRATAIRWQGELWPCWPAVCSRCAGGEQALIWAPPLSLPAPSQKN